MACILVAGREKDMGDDDGSSGGWPVRPLTELPR